MYEAIVDDVAMAAALTRSASASGSAVMGGSDFVEFDAGDSSSGTSGERVCVVYCVGGYGNFSFINDSIRDWFENSKLVN